MARIVGISYHKSVAPSMTLTLWLTTANTTSTNWNASLSMLAHLLMLVIISLTGQTMAQTLTTGSNMMILNTHLSDSINFPDSLIYLFSGSKHNQVHDQAIFYVEQSSILILWYNCSDSIYLSVFIQLSSLWGVVLRNSLHRKLTLVTGTASILLSDNHTQNRDTYYRRSNNKTHIHVPIQGNSPNWAHIKGWSCPSTYHCLQVDTKH